MSAVCGGLGLADAELPAADVPVVPEARAYTLDIAKAKQLIQQAGHGGQTVDV